MVFALLFLVVAAHVLTPFEAAESLDIAVLAPNNDDGCTRRAIEMAFEDVQRILKDKIYNSYVNKTYKLNPHYLEISDDSANALLALYKLFFNGTQMFGLIGPPFDIQGVDIQEFISNKGSITFSYTEADEPITAISYHQTSPTILDRFQACNDLIQYYNWKRIGVLGDLSSSRYSKVISSLVLTLMNRNDKFNKTISTVQYFTKNAEKEVSLLQSRGIRIIVAAMSIQGARLVFCEASQRQMISPKAVWLLFEILPLDWASDKYNTKFNEKTGKNDREIICTENELLQAAAGYIAITRRSIRTDNVKTVSGMTASDFTVRLNDGNGKTKCDSNVAHAYDAVWALAYSHLAISQSEPKTILLRYNNDVYYAHRTFYDRLGSYEVSPIFYVNQEHPAIQGLQFEGITGSYKQKVSGQGVHYRVSVIVFWTKSGAYGDATEIGKYDILNKNISMIQNAEMKLFPGGLVPKDIATYKYEIVKFHKTLALVFWIISCLGVLLICIFIGLFVVYALTIEILDWFLITGCLFCYTSVVVYALDTNFVPYSGVHYSCWAFLILLSIGFTFVSGALFLKAWRLYRIHKAPEVQIINNRWQRLNISQWYLIGALAILVFFDILILVTWVSVSPFSIEQVEISTEQDVDVINVSKILVCSCTKETQFTIAIYCYKGVLLFLSIFIGWQIDRENIKSDSKPIKIAIYNVAAISVIAVVSSSVLKKSIQHETKYAITAVCIIVGTTTTLLLMFVPKFQKLFKSRGDIQETISNNKTERNVYAMSYMRRNTHTSPADKTQRTSITTIATHISGDQSSPTDHTERCSPIDNTIFHNNGSLTSTNSNILSQSPPPYTTNDFEIGRVNEGVSVEKIDEEPENERDEENTKISNQKE